MRFTILGGGACGTLLAGCLAKSGRQVVVLDRNPDRVTDIRQNGIRITGFRSEEPIGCAAFQIEELKQQPPPEIILVCVKPQNVEEAVSPTLQFCSPQTIFVSFLGGLAPFALAKLVGRER